jgi:NAD(P)-dependent dehydrogenase (short-subunit alcohol dehydrogenase family)
MAGKLDNRIALVTGGAQGIGAASARRMAAEGGKVVVAAPASLHDHGIEALEQMRSAPTRDRRSAPRRDPAERYMNHARLILTSGCRCELNCVITETLGSPRLRLRSSGGNPCDAADAATTAATNVRDSPSPRVGACPSRTEPPRPPPHREGSTARAPACRPPRHWSAP